MSMAQTDAAPARKPIRLWPGVAAVAIQWLLGFGLPIFVPEAGGSAILVRLGCGLAVIVWWLFFSRAPLVERVSAIFLMVVALLATSRFVHESIANGMMGFMLVVYSIPVLSLALVAWAAASRSLASGFRRASMVAAILIACGVFTLIRTDGLTGDANSDLEWRWTPTAEEQLLARAGESAPPSAPVAATQPEQQPVQKSDETPASTPAPAVAEETAANTEIEWPGFRGPERNGIVRGVQLETDWSRSPPVEIWRRPIGPGWSSFAVHGDRIYTQEQRGENEVVSAYSLKTGEPLWRHGDATRFWESNAGAGPRGTPTLSHGRVYTLGATGILNALDARDGSVVWSRNAASDTGRKIPDWGIASSPLVIGDTVIAATAGSLAAYDAANGHPRWFGPKGGGGYSSPHQATIDGVVQVVLVNGPGAIGVAPSDGKVLWSHEWPGDSIVQPAVLGSGDLLIGSGSGLAGKTGVLRVTIAHDSGGWTVKERWMSAGLKPYFNDFVVHAGHAFGFDGSILACIDLEDGTRKWKGGRYGHGQLVLLADQDLLLVLSEDGEVALVRAAPDKFTEIARFRALEGKTWNHPVLAGDALLVRNGEEMAAFRLSVANRK